MVYEFADLRARLPVYQHRGARQMFENDARKTLMRIADSRTLSASKRDSLAMWIRESLNKPDSERRAAELDMLTSQARRALR